MSKLLHYQKNHIIICDDLNDPIDKSLDSSNSLRKRSTTHPSLLHSEELDDPWRCLHGKEKDYVFCSQKQNYFSSIDLFLTYKHTLQSISLDNIGLITWS